LQVKGAKVSELSDILGLAIGTVAGVTGQALEWRALSSDEWTAFAPNAAHIDNTGADPVFDDNTEYIPYSGRLVVAESEQVLHDGYQIRVNADNTQVWAIEGEAINNGQNVYEVTRRERLRTAQDRGSRE
jgi:hypothetical protein